MGVVVEVFGIIVKVFFRCFIDVAFVVAVVAMVVFFIFLDASSHLYNRVCPSVGPSVRRLVTHFI